MNHIIVMAFYHMASQTVFVDLYVARFKNNIKNFFYFIGNLTDFFYFIGNLTDFFYDP
ncbi:hypothetical protein [Streptococcus sp. 2106]|uniref:hypothetical protein n=1 Tax=Streptococcus sp. 2106 TaxID=2582642 RepID=UPI001F03607A|nr:hypothetical protein [Streptococcus sp. 2106]